MPFAIVVAVNYFLKDLYVLELGAEPQELSIYFLAYTCLLPLMAVAVGALVCRVGASPNSGIFYNRHPKYGKFGAWYVSGALLGAGSVMWLFVPVFDILEAWFFIGVVIGGWAFALGVLVFNSARCNLFPFKEERARYEAWTQVLFSNMFSIHDGREVGDFILYLYSFWTYDINDIQNALS